MGYIWILIKLEDIYHDITTDMITSLIILSARAALMLTYIKFVCARKATMHIHVHKQFTLRPQNV